jgi:hypothetical protein
MKKIILISLVLFMSATNFFAQENASSVGPKKNAIFLEAGGSAVWYSVNYERKFPFKSMHRITTGIGTLFIPIDSSPIFSGVLTAGYLYGEKHNLELGVGACYLFTDPDFVGSARIGYRYEGNKGVQFRIGISPIYGKFAATGIEEYSGKGVLPWGYISIGYAF